MNSYLCKFPIWYSKSTAKSYGIPLLYPGGCSKLGSVHTKSSQRNNRRAEVQLQTVDRGLNSTSWSAIAILHYLNLCQINSINVLVLKY